ncbi:MAG: GIY-YIG nuclease family protein [Verrucomicrobia bacterium]|nr:GIY-YIG nuclease family protein [Verrucomicrobiota bacterium]
MGKGSVFHYVYILESTTALGRHYVGLTQDLKERLAQHNAGTVSHTRKHKPRVIQIAVAFRDRERAAMFERYLKSGSGRAFSARHF